MRSVQTVLDPGLRYFNSGAFGPVTVRTQRTVAAWSDYTAAVGQGSRLALQAALEGAFCWDRVPAEHRKLLGVWKGTDELHDALGRFLGNDSAKTSLFANTTEGFRHVMYALLGLAVQTVLVTDFEHPAILTTLEGMRRRGLIDVKHVPLMSKVLAGAASWELAEAIAAAISQPAKGRKALVLSHIPYNMDYLMPVSEVCTAAKQAEPSAFAIVDAAHSVGHVPLCFSSLGCDVLVACSHKWLLGPPVTGIVCVRDEELQEALKGVTGAAPFGCYCRSDRDSARVESSAALEPLVGLRAALAQNSEYGQESIYHRILGLRKQLLAEIRSCGSLGLPVHSPLEETGICVLHVRAAATSQARAAAELVRRLECKYGIVVTALERQNAVRACVHYVNTEQEIAELSKAIWAELP